MYSFVWRYRSEKLSLVSGSPPGTATEAISVSSNAGVPQLKSVELCSLFFKLSPNKLFRVNSLNPGRIDPTNAAWDDSRKPLVAEWETSSFV